MGLSPRTKSASTVVLAAADPSPAPCSVEITSADVCGDSIKTTLGPTGASGRFQLTVFGDYSGGPSHKLVDATRAAGTHDDDFKLATLPQGLYDKIEASYEVSGVICHHYFDRKFKNLGTYRHSQYTTPRESDPTCGGPPVAVCKTDIVGGNCTYTPATFRSTFEAEAYENGSGTSIDFGLVQREWFCTTPPPGCTGHRYRPVAQITPGCPGQQVNATTVAVRKTHADLGCGDKVCIVGAGAGGTNIVKTVTDFCPGCTMTQLDNYTNDGRCTGIPNLGDFITIKLF